MKDSFSGYNPIVGLIYYLAVLLFAMFHMNPVFTVISLVCGAGLAVYQNGRKSVRFGLSCLLPVALLTAIINPAFNHRGVTIIKYLPSGNPLTLESVIYGLLAAGLLCSVLTWFYCFTREFTSDKLMYLFGRILPSSSLLISMTLRFVPRFKAELDEVRQAQKCLGKDISQGSVYERTKNLAAIFSAMVTRSLEDSIETADSMKSRGYGLRKRTAYSVYKFTKSDLAVLMTILVLSGLVFAGILLGCTDYSYYPMIYIKEPSSLAVYCYCAYFGLCVLPLIINVKEDIKWKYFLQRN